MRLQGVRLEKSDLKGLSDVISIGGKESSDSMIIF